MLADLAARAGLEAREDGDDEFRAAAAAAVRGRPQPLRPQPERLDTTTRDGYVGLVRATHGWQVPALLGFLGGVNYDQEPWLPTQVMRSWDDRFGTELVDLTDAQVLELLVARPPSEADEAHAVALEQYAYCGDVVDQGVGDVWSLAAEQVCSPSWYFWWD